MPSDAETTSNNVAITGLPRGGTTLAVRLLGELTDTVALAEPMSVETLSEFGSRKRIVEAIVQFFERTREGILTTGTAPSKHKNGKVPDNFFGESIDHKELRIRVAKVGTITISKSLTANFLLAIKHPQAFTALLPELSNVLPCFAMVRNPIAAVASWRTVPIQAQQGRAYVAESLDSELREGLSLLRDPEERQLKILDWYFEKYRRSLPLEHIIRYEDLVSSGGAALRVVTPRAKELGGPLENRNSSRLYAPEGIVHLGERLLARTGSPVWDFYSREEVAESVEKARRFSGTWPLGRRGHGLWRKVTRFAGRWW